MYVIVLSLVFVAVLLSAFVVIVFRKPRIKVFEDGVLIKDFLYPAKLFADTIGSVEMVDVLPKVVVRTNGCSGLKMWKGFFRVKGDVNNKVVLYVDDHRNGPFVKITTNGTTIYINKKRKEQTVSLYDEISARVKIVKKDSLVRSNAVPATRSALVMTAFVLLILALSILPVMLYGSKSVCFELDADSLNIKGMYSVDISFAEFDTVCLLDNMPEVGKRRNGFSSLDAAVGLYEVKGERCRLYLLNKRNPPFIMIRTRDGLLYINNVDSDETVGLYNLLKQK